MHGEHPEQNHCKSGTNNHLSKQLLLGVGLRRAVVLLVVNVAGGLILLVIDLLLFGRGELAAIG